MSKTNKIDIHLSMGKAGFSVLATVVAVLMFFLSFLIIGYTPVRNFIPGYPTEEQIQRSQEKDLLIDSLKRSLVRWEIYSDNLRCVVSGGEPESLDTLVARAAKLNGKK